MSIIMDMCEQFATKDDVQSSVSMVVADTDGVQSAELGSICDDLSRRLQNLEKSRREEGKGLSVRLDPLVLDCLILLCVVHLYFVCAILVWW